MSRIRTGILYWLQVFLFPIHLLSYLIPRNRHLWVFGSTFGRRFADSPRYMYLYMNQYQKSKIHAVWITKNKELAKELQDNHPEYEVYYLYTLKGVWTALRAGVYLYDNYTKDICFTLSGHALKINMWHGVPLKKIQRDNSMDLARHPRKLSQRFKFAIRRVSDEKPWHYVLTTSEELKPIFQSAFGTKHVLVCGYPRNDICNGNIRNCLLEEEKRAYQRFLEERQGKKVVLYMPTFRESEIKFFDVIDIQKFHDFLVNNHILLCIKLHMKSKLGEAFNQIHLTNIMILPQNADPYVFLPEVDVLMTDYSSIYFDFLIFHRPIVFFCYDMDQYLSKSRELYFDYEKATPGVKVKTMDEVENALMRANTDISDDEQNHRELIKNKVLKEESGIYSEKLYQQICKILSIDY